MRNLLANLHLCIWLFYKSKTEQVSNWKYGNKSVMWDVHTHIQVSVPADDLCVERRERRASKLAWHIHYNFTQELRMRNLHLLLFFFFQNISTPLPSGDMVDGQCLFEDWINRFSSITPLQQFFICKISYSFFNQGKVLALWKDLLKLLQINIVAWFL